jgi:ABC-type lipoprotein release transport system permease subunit
VAGAAEPELVFAVDVSSFTKKGFVGTTAFEGGQVDLEFDDGSKGVFLTLGMAKKLHVRKGSSLSILIENDRREVSKSIVGGVGKRLLVSDARTYYSVGKQGGAIIRMRKA